MPAHVVTASGSDDQFVNDVERHDRDRGPSHQPTDGDGPGRIGVFPTQHLLVREHREHEQAE